MRAWLYYRLSRDEDEEMNSLQNQRQILVDYAGQNGYEIVGESFDDNVSGMTFNRKGLGKLEIAVDEGKIDVVLVKDLSRLGRHRTQTELFIDHLRQNNVKVISVTEGIDSFNENDDLLIGFKQIFNDFYAKDISKKVKAGVRQKQKNKGLIESLPLGYKRDRNTNTVLVDDETAWIVQEVFKLYVDGYGLTTIARTMNEGKNTLNTLATAIIATVNNTALRIQSVKINLMNWSKMKYLDCVILFLLKVKDTIRS